MKITSLPYSSAPRNFENAISGQFCGFKGPERTHRSPASLESRRPRTTWPERRCSPEMPESREGREQLLETRVERLEGRVPPSLSMTITRTSLSRGPPSSIRSSFRDQSTYITHSTATTAANQAKPCDGEPAHWAWNHDEPILVLLIRETPEPVIGRVLLRSSTKTSEQPTRAQVATRSKSICFLITAPRAQTEPNSDHASGI